jgi:hypothetical protein
VNRVAASEADQLTVARALVGQETLAAAEGVVRRWRNMPAAERYKGKIGPTAMGLMKSTLAKGTVLELARRGGWRSMRFAKDGRVTAGRVWDRHPPIALRFSTFSMKLIRWLTEAPIARTDCPILEDVHETPADELLMYLAVDLTRKMDCGETLARQAAFRRSGLVWLAFPDVLAHHGVGVPEPKMFDALLEPQALVILEALAPDIAKRWTEIELRKRTVVGGQEMIRLGGTQAAVAHGYLGALDRKKRRDLAQPLIEAGIAVLGKVGGGDHLAGRLEQRGRIADRARARSAAASFLRTLAHLGRWAEEARGVRFFDDDYEAAQLYLTLFEPLGDRGLLRANEIIRELEALDAAAAEAAPQEGEPS